jgi:hypothetical protein
MFQILNEDDLQRARKAFFREKRVTYGDVLEFHRTHAKYERIEGVVDAAHVASMEWWSETVFRTREDGKVPELLRHKNRYRLRSY